MKCIIADCLKPRRYIESKQPYCAMHLERIRRHGYPELKKERGEHGSEKIPHEVDGYILEHCNTKLDKEIAEELQLRGYKNINADNVKYRRRKLGVKKYLYGEVKKHKVWIRNQAIKKYGHRCELCSYHLTVDTHHVLPKYKGGLHEVDNLMVICPNCHALITRGLLIINSREEIAKVQKEIRRKIKSIYS